MRNKKLRVCHYPQVGYNKAFIAEVDNLKEAKLLSETLANYDLYQYKNKFKPDYANVTIIEEWSIEEKQWRTWYDEETGINDIQEYFEYLGE